MINVILSLVVLVLQAAAPQSATPQSSTAVPQPGQVNPAYVVGPTDVIKVRVFDEPALTGDFAVDSDGSITYPLVGRIVLGGKTVREVETLITSKLVDGQYVRRPQVSVEITQYRSRSIYIFGEVRTPGTYKIENQVTLLDVIAQAGSLTPAASDTIIIQRQKDPTAPISPNAPAVEIMRISYTDLREGRVNNADLVLQDGDRLFVNAAEKFYVSGYVKTPGSFVLQPGMTVQQAIAQAGGLTERGSTRGIKITRKTKEGKEITLNNVKMSDLVQPGDTIVIRQRLI